jgi:3-oxoadipate enol-lactonase
VKARGFAEVNGTRLYYEMEGSGHPLVLVHGFSLDTRMWDGQFAAFVREYEVIRYDARGHGRSAAPGDQGYYHTSDLKCLLDFLGCSRTYLVGLSWGAAIVTEFTLAYPQMAGALIAVDPVLWGYPWSPEYEESLGKIWKAGREEGVAAARSLWLAHPMFRPALEKPDVAERLVRIVSDYSGWHWTHDDPGLLPSPPAAARLEDISVPSLAIVGEHDVLDHHAIADELSTRIPAGSKVVIPGVGHMSSMEDVAMFNGIVQAFLAGI